MSTFLANQAKIIAEGAPRVVQNDERPEEHTYALFRLTAVDNTPPSELEAIELLRSRRLRSCLGEVRAGSQHEPSSESV
jgi:hypothetical protein